MIFFNDILEAIDTGAICKFLHQNSKRLFLYISGIPHKSPIFKLVVCSYCYEYTMVYEWLNGQKLSKNAKRIEQ